MKEMEICAIGIMKYIKNPHDNMFMLDYQQHLTQPLPEQ
jgi:hypothetical protein